MLFNYQSQKSEQTILGFNHFVKKKKTSEIQVGNITVKFDNPPTLKAMSPSLSLGCIHCLAICLAMSCLEKYLDDMLIGYVERRGQWKRMDVY